MIKLRAIGGGLGDAIYMRVIVLHLLRQGEPILVYTRYPDLFDDLKAKIEVVPYFSVRMKDPDVRVIGYSTKEHMPPGVDAFHRVCQSAGLSKAVDCRMEWPVRNHALLDTIKRDAGGRKILVYQPLKQANNAKPWSPLAQPRREAFVEFLEQHSQFYRIKLGHPPSVPEDRSMPCELDMWGRAFIFDTFDILSIADLCFSQPCFINAAAEAMDKKYVCMFSRAALNAPYLRVSSTTPAAIFHKPHLARAVYDD